MRCGSPAETGRSLIFDPLATHALAAAMTAMSLLVCFRRTASVVQSCEGKKKKKEKKQKKKEKIKKENTHNIGQTELADQNTEKHPTHKPCIEKLRTRKGLVTTKYNKSTMEQMDFEDITQLMLASMDLKSRSFHLKKYENTFAGPEFLEWLQASGQLNPILRKQI